MNRARNLLPAVLALLVLAAPAKADPVEDLTQLVREASSSANPAMAFLRGLAAMPDFTMNRADIQRALEAAGVPPTGIIRQLLGPTTRLQKRGRDVSIDRSQDTTIRMPNGSAVRLGRKVRARFALQGQHDATIDDIDGIQVGETADALYDLQKVKFTRQNGRPVAMVTAGAFIFSKTVTIDLSPRSTQPRASAAPSGAIAAAAPARQPAPTPGLIGRLPDPRNPMR